MSEKQKGENTTTKLGCEQAEVCPDASYNCKTVLSKTVSENMICKPEKRWMYCHSYKKMLGLKFIKELGLHHLQTCPSCGQNLKDSLLRNYKFTVEMKK